jgi:hypothetical protein
LQGGALPSEQTTFEPGGMTTVPVAGAEDPPPELELQAATQRVIATRMMIDFKAHSLIMTDERRNMRNPHRPALA